MNPDDANQSYAIRPVGTVRVDKEGFRLELGKDYVSALAGLDGFSHIQVFWWAHLVDTPKHRKSTDCGMPYKTVTSSLGVFATRSESRPNPIALTAVGVLNIDHARGVIQIPYIDAEDGTPIVDIKPYHPSIDRIREVSVPAWCSHWPQWYEDSADFDWEAEFTFEC